MRAILVENLEKSFKRRKVLKKINLEIYGGEIFGLFGLNGAGKTTLIKCIVGLLKVDSGKVFVYEKNPDNLEVRKIVGYLPEKPVFYNEMRGFEFLYFLGRISDISKNELKNRINILLDEFEKFCQ